MVGYDMARNTEKRAKWETHTVGPEIWWETVEYAKYREIQTILLGFDKKHWKTLKMRNAHYRTCNTARKLTNKENEKLTLWDLEYGKILDKWEKWETHMVGYDIWRETVKNIKYEK